MSGTALGDLYASDWLAEQAVERGRQAGGGHIEPASAGRLRGRARSAFPSRGGCGPTDLPLSYFVGYGFMKSSPRRKRGVIFVSSDVRGRSIKNVLTPGIAEQPDGRPSLPGHGLS